MNLLLVLNPKAAAGRAGKLLPALVEAFSARGIRTETLITRGCGDAATQLAARDLHLFDGVVAAGGDGTLHEVINGLCQHPMRARCPVGVLPVGTGNAFARDLGLAAGDWRAGIELIAAAHTCCVDAGHVSSRDGSFWFINSIGMGFAVDAARAAKKLKWLGRAAYTLGTLWRVLRLRPHGLRLELDGQVLEQDNLLLMVSNSRYTGTHFLIAPGAEIDDGWLDVTLLRPLPRLRLLRLFPSIYSGGHLRYPEVSLHRARTIRISMPEGFLLAPDGEFRGHTPVEIDCQPAAIRLFCAAGSSPGTSPAQSP